MIWVQIGFAGITAFAFAALVLDELRARLTQPRGASPLAGMSFWDALIALGMIVPILLGGVLAIQSVLT